ncbi:alpha/beta hydrolase [Paenibacillus sp. YYML68]|uniref:alpha/beta hydrolase n=1 Tax=Paenibacillus sp. YYML68 TaxID=2909250 RepID=UPI00249389B4|nr:alpha/beta hydrolase [Paenibacillus sp. YYML68]
MNFTYNLASSTTPATDKPALVLIHGMGLSSSIWERLLPLLLPHYSVVAYDLPGHGLSEESPDSLKPDRLIQDLHALITHLELRSVVLIGHQFGSLVARAYAQHYPSYVQRIVYLSPLFSFPFLLRHGYNQDPAAIFSHLDKWKLMLDQSISLTVHGQQQARLQQQVTQALSRVSDLTYRQALNTIAVWLQQQPSPLLASIETLLLSGEKDQLFTPALAGLVHVYWNTSGFLIVPEAANLMFVDDPSCTFDWLHRFLQQQTSVSPTIVDSLIHEHMRELLAEQSMLEQAKPALRIQCIGEFDVSWTDGAAMPDGWHSRYAKNILLYLAFHRNVSREQLCTDLFPEKSYHSALRNLRVYLNHISKLLDRGQHQEKAITIDRSHVHLHGELAFDLLELQKLLHTASELSEPVSKLFLCRLLLDKFTGPILSGFYDPHALSIKDRLEMQWEKLAIWAARQLLSQRKPHTAIEFLLNVQPHSGVNELQVIDLLIEAYRLLGAGKEQSKWLRRRRKLARDTPT